MPGWIPTVLVVAGITAGMLAVVAAELVAFLGRVAQLAPTGGRDDGGTD